MIFKIILKIAVNAGAIYLAHLWIDGVTLHFDETNLWSTAGALALVGLVLWMGQMILKPILKVLTFPLLILTFGLFGAVINIFIIWGASVILPQLEIIGLLPLIWATVLVSLINAVFFFI